MTRVILLGFISVAMAALLGCGSKNESGTAPAKKTIDIVTGESEQNGLPVVSRGTTAESHISNGTHLFVSEGIVAYVEKTETGRRLRAVDATGADLPLNGLMLDEDSEIYISDHLLSVLTRESGGDSFKLQTVNNSGQKIPTQSVSMHKKPQVFISNNIIAFVAELRRTGDLIETKADGSKVYSTVSEGDALFAYNYRGVELNTKGHRVDDESQVLISEGVIAYTAMSYRLGEQTGPNSRALVPNGRRLYAFSDRDLELRTSAETIDRDSQFIITSRSIVMRVPNYVPGERLGENSYALVQVGKKTVIYGNDGSYKQVKNQ